MENLVLLWISGFLLWKNEFYYDFRLLNLSFTMDLEPKPRFYYGFGAQTAVLLWIWGPKTEFYYELGGPNRGFTTDLEPKHRFYYEFRSQTSVLL
jgi:hypothetical protein